MEAIQKFAGDADESVVEAEAQSAPSGFDDFVTHYDVIHGMGGRSRKDRSEDLLKFPIACDGWRHERELQLWMQPVVIETKAESKMVLRPRSTSSRSFRKAFAFAAIWLVVVSLIASAHNHTRSPGAIFGELLVPSVIAAVVAGTVGRLVHSRFAWLSIVVVFMIVWFAVRFAVVVTSTLPGQ